MSAVAATPIVGTHPYADKFPMLPEADLVLEGFASDPICNVRIVESLEHPGFHDVRIYAFGQCIELTRPCRDRQMIARFVGRETRAADLDWRTSPRRSVESERPSSAVYFVADEDGFIKIGTAGSVKSRMQSLQTASRQQLSLLATIPGGRTEEAHLHRRFKSDHERGEWFRPSAELRKYISEVSS